MTLNTYLPTGFLRPFVKCYIIVDCDETVLNTMLPDTSLIMGFRYKGTTKYITDDLENSLPFAVVAGLRKSVQLMRDSDNTANLLVIFNAAGANAFIREPLHQLFGEITPLNDFSDFKELNEIEDKLCGAASDKKRIELVEQFLLSKLYNYKTDPLVSHALHIIKSHNGFVRVKDLADQLFISIDAFEKRFRQKAGASPKQICKIIRMNAAIQNLQNNKFIETALEAGYYDQAHFAKDFKLFTGQTPTEFLNNNP